jgi:cell division initiation protein
MREEDDVSTGASRRRLTPVDVQQQQFKRSFRGYDEQEVDDFLDRVTEAIGNLLEENERLKEEARRAPTTRLEGAADASDTSRTVAEIKRQAEVEADDIIREARLRADAIVRDAELRAGVDTGGRATAASGDSSQLSRFVLRERSFLQELASLIQSHAEAVKSMVQEARERQRAEPASATGEDMPRQPSREPFGPPGASAGRDIEASDDAAVATAGTADADEGADLGLVSTRGDTPSETEDAGKEETTASPSGPAIIEVPEAAEDRAAHEAMWAERETAGGWKSRVEEPAGASVAPGGTADDREEERRRRSDRAGDTDSALGDLFWGEE